MGVIDWYLQRHYQRSLSKKLKKQGKQTAHIMIFINVELSRQVLVLLLYHNEHALERERDRERCKDVNRGERERGNEMDREGGLGPTFFFGGGGGVTLRAVSCHHSPAPPETGHATP